MYQIQPKEKDLNFQHTLQFAQQAAFKGRFNLNEIVHPVSGSILIEPVHSEVPQGFLLFENNTFHMKQTVLITCSKNYSLSLHSSEFIKNRLAYFNFSPILSFTLLGRAQCYLIASSANIGSLQFSIQSPINPFKNRNQVLFGLNLKTESLKQKQRIQSYRLWISSLNKRWRIEYKNSQNNQNIVASYQYNLAKDIEIFCKINMMQRLPQLQLGVQLQKKNFTIQSIASLQGKNQKLENNLIVEINAQWKTVFQTIVRDNRIQLNLGIKNDSFYLQIPIFWDFTQKFLDKLVLLGVLGTLFGIFVKINKDRENLKQIDSHSPQNQLEKKRESQRQTLYLLDEKIKENYQIEKQRNGLIILEAFYGKSDHIHKIEQNQDDIARFHLMNQFEIIDVTLPLIFWTKDSQLYLPKQTKSSIIGFCDPCLNEQEPKILFIKYQYQNETLIKTFKDDQEIKLP